MLSPYERFLMAYLGKMPDQVPLAISPFPVKGVPELEKSPMRGYYGFDPRWDPETRMRKNIEFTVKFAERFPEVCVTGGAIASVHLSRIFSQRWGREIAFKESDRGGFAYTKPLLEDISEADKLYVPDLRQEPMMVESLGRLERHLELEAEAFAGLEDRLASGLKGWSGSRVVENCIDQGLISYQDFMVAMRFSPEKLHRLIDFMADYVIETLRVTEDVMGKISKVTINDHSPTFMSRKQFQEFWIPYVARVNKAFSGALRIYHNEGEISHLVDLIPEAGFDAYQVGPETDIGMVKKTVGDRLALLGNIDPVDLLPFKSPRAVEEACREAITKAAPGGGFILSTGGGPPRVPAPLENFEAMIKAAKKYGKYPLSP